MFESINENVNKLTKKFVKLSKIVENAFYFHFYEFR